MKQPSKIVTKSKNKPKDFKNDPKFSLGVTAWVVEELLNWRIDC